MMVDINDIYILASTGVAALSVIGIVYHQFISPLKKSNESITYWKTTIERDIRDVEKDVLHLKEDFIEEKADRKEHRKHVDSEIKQLRQDVSEIKADIKANNIKLDNILKQLETYTNA